MGFDFKSATKITSLAPESAPIKLTLNITPLSSPIKKLDAKPEGKPEAKPTSTLASAPTQVVAPLATPTKLEGLDLLDSADLNGLDYKAALADMPSLEELAEEFQYSEQPEKFDDAALAAVHKACLKLESAIDNAEEVREQLTFIMTELRRFPEVAAKIYDGDIKTMVSALRQNYNVVAFAKATNKKKKEEKQSAIKEQLAIAEASGLFDGLDI